MLLIVGQRIRAAWVIRSAQLDEDFHCRAIARGFGLGDIDGLRIEIDRVNLAARIELITSYAPQARIGSTSLLRRISLHSASPSNVGNFAVDHFVVFAGSDLQFGILRPRDQPHADHPVPLAGPSRVEYRARIGSRRETG